MKPNLFIFHFLICTSLHTKRSLCTPKSHRLFFCILLDSILKNRDITLLTKVRIVKAMGFPVVMCGCESWTTKKAEHWRTDAFKLWCWRRLLSPLDNKEIKPANPKGNQPWIFIGRTDAEAEAPILRPPDAKNGLTGKDPNAGKDWGQLEKGMTRWLDGIPTQWTWVWVSSGRWWRTGKPGVLQSMGSQRVRHNQATEQQQLEVLVICLGLFLCMV